MATNDGLVALYLAVVRPASFITVSAWTGWLAIEFATEGDIRKPMATRNTGRIVAGEATHYEILATGVPAAD